MAALITNIAIRQGGKKESSLVSVNEFMLNWDIKAPQEVKRQSVTDMKKTLLQLANIQNRKKTKVGIQPKPIETKLKDGKHSVRQSGGNTGH
jgi:hypothetical protein